MNHKPSRKNPDLIYGTRALLEAFEAGREIEKIFIQKHLNDLLQEVIQRARELHVPVSKVPTEKLNRLTRKNHQGVVAFISPIAYASLENIIDSAFRAGKEPFVIVLDGVTDVRNLGAIARTAECAGVDGMLIPSRGNAQVNSDAVKTSAGALHSLPVVRSENLSNSLKYLQDSGIRLVACTEKDSSVLYEADLKGPVALVLGSEETGISDKILRMCDQSIAIPQFGSIASLNVSVAAGVAIYEVIRQRS